MHHLVGISEICRMLNVSRQRADALTRKTDFPAPVAALDAGRVWDTEAIEEWARSRGRMIHDWSDDDPSEDR